MSFALKHLVSTPAALAAEAIVSGFSGASHGCFIEGKPGIGVNDGIQTEGGRQMAIRAAIKAVIITGISKAIISA